MGLPPGGAPQDCLLLVRSVMGKVCLTEHADAYTEWLSTLSQICVTIALHSKTQSFSSSQGTGSSKMYSRFCKY
jgi:hypothetical protein